MDQFIVARLLADKRHVALSLPHRSAESRLVARNEETPLAATHARLPNQQEHLRPYAAVDSVGDEVRKRGRDSIAELAVGKYSPTNRLGDWPCYAVSL